MLWGAVGLDGLAGSSSQQRRVTKKGQSALASVALWIEHQPSNQRVAGLIPSQGTYLSSQGCGPGPQCTVYEKQPCMDVSLPSSLSKNKYNLFLKNKGSVKDTVPSDATGPGRQEAAMDARPRAWAPTTLCFASLPRACGVGEGGGEGDCLTHHLTACLS